MMPGVLYIVATAIGNPEDITLRAIKTLGEVKAIICEEYREGSTLLKSIGVPQKEFIRLSEHNEKERSQEIMDRILKGEDLALVSDCGTPVFADPGQYLIHFLLQHGIKIVPIPGPSSLMTALSIVDIPIHRFFFAGFPPKKTEDRIEFYISLLTYKMPIILMDTPYRLSKMLEEVCKYFGPKKKITLATNLTVADEMIYRGEVLHIYKQTQGKRKEFILIIHS